jgi:DNA-directed RNA polymerase specialized sigma24 family protein
MKYIFIGQCLADAALLPMISLSEPVQKTLATVRGGTADLPIGDLVPDLEAPDETSILTKMTLAKLPAFLDTLSPPLRTITHAYYWLGKTQAEIAAAMGVTQSAIAHALARVHQLGRRFFGITEH